jgi:thioredoxin 1
MPPMTWILYVVLGLTVTWILYVLYIQLASRSAEGRPAGKLARVVPGLEAAGGQAMVYCYTPACGPCRTMTKDVEALQAEYPQVFKLDISGHFDMVRELGVRATPTVLMLRDGRIERCVVGAKNQAYLRSLLGETKRNSGNRGRHSSLRSCGDEQQRHEQRDS